ncbi:NYN domain-containing protein [Xylophilus sp. ASV27]|uniref:NYN domain-containing protein n=1 Tax=Xylophilus sp. ASV27 TaxID=2795129 RepID=UPI0018EB46C5|nr:NYN domain-containing protein [Xylophilus sp. ASV27]
MPHAKTDTTAFLIDADNLSPAAVEEAFAKLGDLPGVITVRRAYGGADKLAGLREVMQRHAVRGFLNHGKGSTDVALAVDAVDVLYQFAPGTVAIGSGDADFVPLVVRLREAGVRVICFAQADKAAADIAQAYDAVIHVGGRVTAAFEPRPRPSLVARAAPPAPAPVAAAPVRAPRAARSVAGAARPEPAEREVSEQMRQVLAAIPDWQIGGIKQLNALGKPLYDAGIKRGSKPLHELFRKYPAYFEIHPQDGPARQVKLLRRP